MMDTAVYGPRFASPPLRPEIAKLDHASVQVNGITIGTKTVDFSQKISLEDLEIAVTALKQLGYDYVVPTIVTTSPEVLEHNLKIFAKAMNSEWGRGFIAGVHLEGPLIHPLQKGAHPLEHILDVEKPKENLALFKSCLEWSRLRAEDQGSHCVVMVTLDPSRDKDLNISRYLSNNGVVVCMAHHRATLQNFKDLVGVARITGVGAIHVPNTWKYDADTGRDTGFLMAEVLNNTDVTVHVVCDGRHVLDEQIGHMSRFVGDKRLCVTDDVSPLLTAVPKEDPYLAFGREFRIHAPEDLPPNIAWPWPTNDGWTHSKDLSGSTVPGPWQVQRFADITGWQPDALQRVSFSNAARSLAVPHARLGFRMLSKDDKAKLELIENGGE